MTDVVKFINVSTWIGKHQIRFDAHSGYVKVVAHNGGNYSFDVFALNVPSKDPARLNEIRKILMGIYEFSAEETNELFAWVRAFMGILPEPLTKTLRIDDLTIVFTYCNEWVVVSGRRRVYEFSPTFIGGGNIAAYNKKASKLKTVAGLTNTEVLALWEFLSECKGIGIEWL